MAEGTPENKVTYFTVQGHSHDGVNSTKIDFSGYDLFDFISEGDLERLILSVVDSNPIRPRGGIIIEATDGSGDGVFIGPDVPGPATGLAHTCSINEAGDTVRNVTWTAIPRATSYLLQLHRSIDEGYNYLKVQEVETKLTSHAFEAAPMASSSLTRYKLIVQGQSDAGILGLTQTISDIQPCVDAVAPAGPKFEDSTSSPNVPNHLVSFRGFLARLQEQTEADTKWGIGEFEYSVSTSLASEGQWVSNEAESGRQTGRIISVTGLATGTAYYLRVRAIDNSNNASPWTYWNGTGDDGDSTMSNADSFTPAEIIGTEITSNSITTSHIQANQIVSNLIAADQITANEIAANAVEADHIKANELFVGVGIQSNSYSAGSAGFKINYDGTAEFNNNVTMKGATISDSSLTVSSGSPSEVKFRVTSSGNTTINGTLTVGDYASGKGMNWDGSDLTVKGEIVSTAGTIGGWTLGANKLYSGTDIELLKTEQTIALGGGKAVMKRFTSGLGSGDLKIGIDASAGYDPVYGTAGDMLMWWDHSHSLAKFSLSDKLLFDGSNVSLVDGTITGAEIEGGSISISSGKFAVDEYGNLIAKSISLGDAAAPTSYSNSMIMGGGSLHKIRISSSAFGLYSDTTALEWYDSNLSTRRGYLTGGQLGAVGANVDLGVQLGGDDNKQNYIAAYQASVTGDGIMITAHKTSYNDITISAGGFIDLDAAEGIEIAQKSSAPSSASGKLYNHNGTLKWGTTSLTGGGGGAVDSIVAGDNIQVSGATGDVTVTFDGSNVSLVDGTITASTIQTASSGARVSLSPVDGLSAEDVDTGTAQAGANTTITLKSGSSGTNDYYNDLTITLTGGPGNGQVRTISDYNASSKVASVSQAWTTNPTSSTTYSITRKTNTFLSGYTGKTTEDYPGFIYYYGERDSVTHSRQWGRVAFSSPRFSAAIAYTGFVFSHSDDGWGELTFGLPNHADQFVIADAGSGSTPTNTFNRGGITIVSGTPASTNNTLYADGTTLKWHGAPIGGGSGVDSIIAGTNVQVSGATGDVTVSATDTTYTAGLAMDLNSGAFDLDLSELTAATPVSSDYAPFIDSNGNASVKSYIGTMVNSAIVASTNVQKTWDNTAKTVTLTATDTTYTSSDFNHDSLTGFVANEHIDWTQASAGTIHSSNYTSSGYTEGDTIRAAHGSSTAPGYSFTNDTNLGFYKSDTDEVTFSAGSSVRLRMNLNGLENWGGSVATPGYAFYNDDNTGMYRISADKIGFATNGTERIRIEDTNILVSKDFWPVNAVFQPGPNVWTGIECGNSSHAWEDVYTRSLSGTSDVNLKTDIQDATYGLDFVKGLRPRTFKWKHSTDSLTKEVRAGIRLHHGFIAQEVETLLGDDADSMGLWSHGYQKAVPGDEGEEDIEESWHPNLRYLEFIPILTKAIQELEARLAALEA